MTCTCVRRVWRCRAKKRSALQWCDVASLEDATDDDDDSLRNCRLTFRWWWSKGVNVFLFFFLSFILRSSPWRDFSSSSSSSSSGSRRRSALLLDPQTATRHLSPPPPPFFFVDIKSIHPEVEKQRKRNKLLLFFLYLLGGGRSSRFLFFLPLNKIVQSAVFVRYHHLKPTALTHSRIRPCAGCIRKQRVVTTITALKRMVHGQLVKILTADRRWKMEDESS